MPKTDADYVPKAVKDQEDKAKAAQAAEIDKKKPVKKKKAEPAPEAAATETPGFEAAAAVPDDPTAAPIVAPAEAQPAAADGEDFKQKYLSLQGMYQKDTGELKTAVTNLTTQMQGQQAVITSLNGVLEALPAKAAAAAPEAAPAPANVLDVKDFGGYGDEMGDLLKVVNNISKRLVAVEAKVAQVSQAAPAQATDPNLTQRLDRIEETQVMTVKDHFYKDLNDAVPGWGKQNHDPKFHLWLDELDAMSNVKRSALLKFAFDRFNSKQVIAIFKGFQPVAAAPEPGETLVAQVVPETTGNAGDHPGGTPEKVHATLEEWKKAQKDFIDGRITEEAQDKIANSYQAGLYAKK